MNLDRGLHLPSVWNPVFDLTWPLIPYFVCYSTPRPMSCMLFHHFSQPLLSYIPFLVTSVFVPNLIIAFTLFTHVFVTSPLCNHINSLLSQHFSTCKQLTKNLGSKSPAVDWIIVVYCSSVNFNLVTILFHDTLCNSHSSIIGTCSKGRRNAYFVSRQAAIFPYTPCIHTMHGE